ncbi:uncharacterized protein LOC135937225 [Cloeon dipterum]|uniref:uncharacterized protein LOC135937225 n=1 Tax=Cloeon dipterum TaxID=197152 RepID=UPI00321FBC9F
MKSSRTIFALILTVVAAAVGYPDRHNNVKKWAEDSWRMFQVAARRDLEAASENFGVHDVNTTLLISTKGHSECRVYVAIADPWETLSVVFPDRYMPVSDLHGILLLDPFPKAYFGHPVLIFFIERASQQLCDERKGHYLHGKRLCIYVKNNNRCIEMKRNKFPFDRSTDIDCALNFIPLVEGREAGKQKLTCRENIGNFYTHCPVLRDAEDNRSVYCDKVRYNTQHCNVAEEAAEANCSIWQRCDHAIILSGGWNRQLSEYQSYQNVKKMHKMFKHIGFGENIKIFYANGEASTQEMPRMYSSILKESFKKYLRTLCNTKPCVETLVIYLNSPTLPNGNSLLWDADNNGVASFEEQFTVDEMLSSLQDCSANQVVLLVDQSYSGVFTMKQSKNRKLRSNVIIVTSTSERQAAFGSDFSEHWSLKGLEEKCINEIYDEYINVSRTEDMTSLLLDTGSGASHRLTLTGGSCSNNSWEINPSKGCENLSSHYLWRDYKI